MAFDADDSDEALRTAWRAFCARLVDAGEQAFKDYNPRAPAQRADAFRFLTQNLGQAFDLALETRNTRFPVIHAFCSPFCKLGGDNADFIYQQAWIDGQTEYKLSGNVGSAPFLNFAVQGPRVQPRADWRPLSEPFGDTPECNIFGHDLVTGWDGSFELFIGGPRRDCNWLPTTPDSRKLFIRQGFDDWSEKPATLRIERIGLAEPRPVPMPDEMIAAMAWAGDFIIGSMLDKPDHPYAYAAEVDPAMLNQFPGEHRATEERVAKRDTDSKRGRTASVMCWQLAPDEALVVEFDHHPDFWMMTNMGMFFNSMDFLYRPVSYTPSRARIDADGKLRLILAHRDPGFQNWIDTQGFERGHLANRNLLTSRVTEFRTQLVKHDVLAQVLPADTARITPEQRSAQLRQRFHAIQRRFRL